MDEEDIDTREERSIDEEDCDGIERKMTRKEKKQHDEFCIKKVEEMQSKNKNKILLKNYITWYAMKADGRDLSKEKERKLKKPLDKTLEYLLQVCRSKAWGDRYEILKRYPEQTVVEKRKRLPGGDLNHLHDCEVCKRPRHLWSVRVKLHGKPYDKYQEEMMEGNTGHIKYYMGCFCYERFKLFHDIYHFGNLVYKECCTRLNGSRKKSVRDVMHDEDLFEKKCSLELAERLREFFTSFSAKFEENPLPAQKYMEFKKNTLNGKGLVEEA